MTVHERIIAEALIECIGAEIGGSDHALALQQVDGLGEVGGADVFGEGGVLALKG